MKKILILLFGLCITLFSCDKKSVYSKFYDLPENHQWQKTDEQVFEFTIEDDSKLYDIIFKFGHVYDYQFDNIPINFVIENPSGEKEKTTIDLMIKDSSGKEIADCGGDICDLKLKIKEKTKLSKGNYKVTFSHSFKGPYLPNVLGIGLNVEIVN
ncbi:hypothetical protein [Flavobacterium sp.]|uniref:hypothetical protein n=1 Tax=Flavobacterium sp. TaxID=239 RepID=UPI00374D1D58